MLEQTPNSPEKHPKNLEKYPEKLEKKETHYIKNRRDMLDLPGAKTIPEVGLAFSGGGIRSACFNLGVAKSLANGGVFKHIDILSTVSGGGYIGSAISWFYQHSATPDIFPFGTHSPLEKYGNEPSNSLKKLSKKSSNKTSEKTKKKTFQNPVFWEEKLRYGANYLTPSKDINGFSLLGAITKVMLSNLIVWGLLSCALLLLMISLPNDPAIIFNASILISLLLTFIFVVIVVLYSFASSIEKLSQIITYQHRYRFAKYFNRAFSLLLFFVTIGVLPFIQDTIADYQAQLGSIGLIIGLLGLGKRTMQDDSPADWKLVVYSSLILYGLLLCSYSAAHWIHVHYPNLSPRIALYFLGFSVSMGCICNSNYISITRYYRDRLMELFLPDLSDDLTVSKEPARALEANNSFLKEFNQHGGPYHIINCNLVAVDSTNNKLKSRGGENFIYSPFFCGSTATGWKETKEFMGGNITLASAMATSGAAASPNAGCGGMGITRNRVISFTMRLLNIRMGIWSTNPGIKHPFGKIFNHFTPGFTKALGIGKGLSEKARTIELTDGGHFSNLAMYELARRKMPVILACDAGADPDYAFSDFKISCDRIRTDFGYTIKMHSSVEDASPNYPALSDVVPSKNTSYPRNSQFAHRGHLFGVINYEPNKPTKDAKHGLVIYLKPTLLEELSRELLNYKGNNPSFPNVSTADQFFDEDQVTAYSALGYEITALMLNKIPDIMPIIKQYPHMLINEWQLNVIFGNDHFDQQHAVA